MTAYRVATRFALLGLARNRLAVVLLVGFVPLWITVVRAVVPRQALAFRLDGSSDLLHASGNQLALITGSLNAVTLLVGFMMFSATQYVSAFDRRLVAAGYSRAALLLAKLTTLAVAATAVSGYTTVWTLLYWSPLQPVLAGFGVLVAGLVYGALGLFLALFLPGELEGMVAIIMISIIDLVPQSPVVSSAASSSLVRWLPSYGAMQTCLRAGFTRTISLSPLATSVLWLGGAALVALAAFAGRTRVFPRETIVPAVENTQSQ